MTGRPEPGTRASRRLVDANRVHHLSEMPLGLVGEEWEPGGAEFEKARKGTARSLTRLSRRKWPADEVMDWEVRSWLRHKHYGDPTMTGLHAAMREQECAVLSERAALGRAFPAVRDLFDPKGPAA